MYFEIVRDVVIVRASGSSRLSADYVEVTTIDDRAMILFSYMGVVIEIIYTTLDEHESVFESISKASVIDIDIIHVDEFNRMTSHRQIDKIIREV